MNKNKFQSGKKDVLIIISLLLAALVIWGVYTMIYRVDGHEGIYGEIMLDGITVGKRYLSDEGVFSLDAIPHITFEVKNQKIAFIDSNCPDKVCILTGWLDAGAHFSACMPNRTLLWIVEDESQSLGIPQ